MLASMSFPSSIRFQLKPYPNKHDFFNNDHYQHDNLVLALQHFPKHIVVKYYSLTSFFFFRYRPQCPFLLQHLGEQRIEHERRYAVFYPNEIELGADGMWRQLTSNSPSSRSSPNETDEDNDSILAQTTSSAEISVSEDDSDSEQNTCCQRCRCCICWVAAKNCIFFMRPHGNLFRMQQKRLVLHQHVFTIRFDEIYKRNQLRCNGYRFERCYFMNITILLQMISFVDLLKINTAKKPTFFMGVVIHINSFVIKHCDQKSFGVTAPKKYV